MNRQKDKKRSGFEALGLRFWVQGSGFEVLGSSFWVQGSGFEALFLGLRF